MEFTQTEKETFAELCREHGLTVTGQRMAIYYYMQNLYSHPTADQVYEGIHTVHPTISRASVYRILDALAKYGLIQKIAQPGTASRYDGMVKRHPHLVCSECGSVIDLECGKLNIDRRVNTFLDDSLGFLPDGSQLSNYAVVFTGICAECAKNKQKGAQR